MTLTTQTSSASIRHFLRSLVYRFRHVTSSAPAGFATFEAGKDVRSPIRIVRHMSVLIQFAHAQFGETEAGKLAELEWDDELQRFLDLTSALDRILAQNKEVVTDISLEQLWQGPIIDAMTHVGQLATLRRLAGSPLKGVRYWAVDMPAIS